MQILQDDGLFGFQRTISDSIEISGIGIHSGDRVRLRLSPAKKDTGILFKPFQSDDLSKPLYAFWSNIVRSDLCTVLRASSYYVSTVEHLMAAFYALGIDNIIVETSGSEVPIMDGSAAPFLEAIERVGITVLDAKRRYIRIIKDVYVCCNGCWAGFIPCNSTRFEIAIDFDTPAIGYQKWEGDFTEKIFREELCSSRTFGFFRDVEKYRKSGYALGASLENCVVISEDDQVMNSQGLRYPRDEFVRHKTVDAIGDMALAGAQFIGCYRSWRGGHGINFLALCSLFSDSSSYEIVEDNFL
ncbi:UDP-3-O-acyl-N-acetylglucosamine deacetylase [Candidatus Liberibacter sp.]|uniref:UDP-3-O-acyl-N-acetylglucosamine deacetylase n=1 Tax=Candidatus Liberibacter sp. TaxID=34022 RepID=UPI0015F626DF|nr:UDP-3-O-acyl-N-acetylglucosamine deacetylase [Candidatus Liberibacter sp.]MBA5724291.1 UDP-3-O-acyl-N-acetylglucosamine deacetylase [Candidatus Liberibacter sp.]